MIDRFCIFDKEGPDQDITCAVFICKWQRMTSKWPNIDLVYLDAWELPNKTVLLVFKVQSSKIFYTTSTTMYFRNIESFRAFWFRTSLSYIYKVVIKITLFGYSGTWAIAGDEILKIIIGRKDWYRFCKTLMWTFKDDLSRIDLEWTSVALRD